MTTMNISLSEELKEFVEDQGRRGGYASVEEYLLSLVRDARQQQARQELREMILEGLKSPAREFGESDLAELRERIYSRHPELRPES